jgi:hypothetical protein
MKSLIFLTMASFAIASPLCTTTSSSSPIPLPTPTPRLCNRICASEELVCAAGWTAEQMGVRTFRQSDPVIREADPANKILGMLGVLSCGVRRDETIWSQGKRDAREGDLGVWSRMEVGEEGLRVEKLRHLAPLMIFHSQSHACYRRLSSRTDLYRNRTIGSS